MVHLRAMIFLSMVTLPDFISADTISYRDFPRGDRTIEGNVVAESTEGDILVETADGKLIDIEKIFIQEHKKSDTKVPLDDREKLVKSLQTEYGTAFNIHETKNYIIVYDTKEQFAVEAGKLFERLKSVFENYLRRQMRFEPENPRQPLIAVIFQSREQYVRYMKDEIGIASIFTAGVYIPSTNRMYMFDNFGGEIQDIMSLVARISTDTANEIARELTSENISTVIHEGAHQVAFNSGFHRRGAREPAWFSEGLATLLEVPELDSKKRWAGVGQLNLDRAMDLKENISKLPLDVVRRIVVSDEYLRDPETASTGYSVAWGLSYYLSKTRKSDYQNYMKTLRERPLLEDYEESQRLDDFRKGFGETPEQIEPAFRRWMEKNVFRKIPDPAE